MMFLGGTISWAFYREWEWPQTVFIVLHCLVLLMKQHSYAFYTGWLSIEFLRRQRLKKELSQLSDDTNTGLTGVDSIAEDRERLIREIEIADRDLTGTTLQEMTYPNNLTYANFLDYMLCPTLVYELEYPRTNGYPPTCTVLI
jgi:sterol O-acyltransferase